MQQVVSRCGFGGLNFFFLILSFLYSPMHTDIEAFCLSRSYVQAEVEDQPDLSLIQAFTSVLEPPTPFRPLASTPRLPTSGFKCDSIRAS